MARLRQRNKPKTKPASRSATPILRPKEEKTVPPTADSDGSTTPMLMGIKPETYVSETHGSMASARIRFRTPTATDLATIPSEHVTPCSTPATSTETIPDKLQVRAVLQKMMGHRLPPDGLANYEVMISNLVRRGAKEATIRKRYHPALVDFFKDHLQAVPVHNKFAMVYNKQFEGQHERYHLPVYGHTDAMEVVMGETEVKVEDHGRKRKRSASFKPRSRGARSQATTSSWQLDGAMDISPSDKVGPPGSAICASSPLHRSPSHSTFANPSDGCVAPPMGHGQDTEVNDSHDTPHAKDVSAAERTTPSSMEGFQDSYTTDIPGASAETVEQAQQQVAEKQTSPIRVNLSLRAFMHDMAEISSLPPAPVHDGPGEQNARVDLVMTNGLIDKENHGRNGDNESGNSEKHQHTPPSTVASSSMGPSRPYFPIAKSARSYLAWLHHRRMRFPTVAPNYAECKIIANRLGRPSSNVLVEALYHWGFETGNTRSEWYRQNRSVVLGEDPRFDEEDWGRWIAWLKDGRDANQRRKR